MKRSDRSRLIRISARSLTLGLALVLAGSMSLADVLLLKDGRRFEGTVKRQSAQEIVFETRFGELTFPMSLVSKLEKGRTPSQEFDERWKTCETADEFHALGLWAAEQKLRTPARKAMKRARQLDADHRGASTWLGLVEYGGRWMEPEERDALLLLAEEAEMLRRGLVRHAGEWVTLHEKSKLDAGFVYFEGRWLNPVELKRAQGLELFEGEWLPTGIGSAMVHVQAVLSRSGVPGQVVHGANAAVGGPFPSSFLRAIATGLDRGRAWFDEHFESAPGVALLGGQLAEFYVWDRDSKPYLETVDELVALTDTVPDGWGEAAKHTHGFWFCHPLCISSARVRGRPQDDLSGHSFHHWGHLLVNRQGYDGRLLPPWFDEGFASLAEFRIHQRNAVFCIANPATFTSVGATSSARVEHVFDTKKFRRGTWRETLALALGSSGSGVPGFDKLAQRRFGQLTLIDIAMGILNWLEERGEGALERFHGVLRRSAPDAPLRVATRGADRQARYDEAFGAAVDLGWRAADEEWRAWFLKTNPLKTTNRRR